MLEKGEKLH